MMNNILPSTIIPPWLGFGVSAFITGNFLTIILGLFFIFYLGVSLFLLYHWVSYGMNSAGIILAEVVFTTVSVVLFTIAVLSINYY